MIFTELVLENFGPYAGKQVINLRPETEENPRPIILLGGMNGGGKTTLMDAIRLALYGSRAQCSTRGNLSYSDFLTQCVNNQTPLNEKARIELAFEHIQDDHWVEHRIVRYWTKKPKDGKDNLGILENSPTGEWPEKALAETWDEYIETLLPLGISNLFLFDGEQVRELAEQDVPTQPVIAAIQSLLGLELSERLAIDLDILVNRKRKALANSTQLSDLDKIEDQIAKYQQEADIIEATLSQLQQNLENALQKRQEAMDKFRIEGGQIATDSSKLKSQEQDLEKAIEKQQEELCKLAAGMLPLTMITHLLEQAKQQGKAELNHKKIKLTLEVLQQRDQRLLTYLNNLSFPDTNLKQITEFLNQDIQQFTQNTEENLNNNLQINEDELNQLTNILEHQLPLQINLAKQQLENLQKVEIDLDTIQQQLAVAASPENYQKLEKVLEKAQQNYLKCKAELDAGQRNYEAAKKAVERAKKQLQQYSEQAIERANNEHLISAVTKVQDTLQLFRERLTLKKLNKLEGEASECFRYLLHKSNLVHRVAIDENTFSLSLYSPEGSLVPKHRLSAGEKQLLAIAFLWGLARVSGRNLPVAIDTPLGRLDSSHRSNLLDRYFPTASHQVILLSTDTEIGQGEVEHLRQLDAIAKQYLLEYDSSKRQTTIHPDRYFW
jgi:DNA sulfur modification protein DndD